MNISTRHFNVYVNLLLGVVMLAALGGCETLQRNSGKAHASVRDGVFVHIKSGPEQAHAVLMGLRMAQMMKADRDVLVYFDVDGVQIVKQDGEPLAMEPFGSSHEMIDDLVQSSAQLYACPGCMKAADLADDDLLPGVKVAEKDAFFNFTKGRILTLDY